MQPASSPHLDRLDHAKPLPRSDGGADLGQLHVDKVAQLLLRSSVQHRHENSITAPGPAARGTPGRAAGWVGGFGGCRRAASVQLTWAKSVMPTVAVEPSTFTHSWSLAYLRPSATAAAGAAAAHPPTAQNRTGRAPDCPIGAPGLTRGVAQAASARGGGSAHMAQPQGAVLCESGQHPA